MNPFLQTRLINPILAQLKRGTSPVKLAQSFATGLTLAFFPLLGLQTPLGLLAGAIFRLNHPTIQAINYLATPIQYAALPIFIYAGERLWRLPHVSYNPKTIAHDFMTAPLAFLQHYGKSGGAGVTFFLMVAPFIFYLSYRLFFFFARRQALGIVDPGELL